MSSRQGSRTKLSTRFILSYAVTYLVMIGLMGFIVDRAARSALLSDIDSNLVATARLATESLPDDPASYQDWARDTFTASGFRLTLMDDQGVVLADSHVEPAGVGSQLDNPEVKMALIGETGTAQRVSESTGFEQRYAALPVTDGLIVRTSVSTRVIGDDLGGVRTSILLAALGVGLVGVVLVTLLARFMTRPISGLTEQARAVAQGDVSVAPRRSRVEELDQLGMAISAIAERLGSRLTVAEEATATLGVVLEALPQGTILVDGSDTIVYDNPAAGAILGVVPPALSGLAPLQLQTAVREARRDGEIKVRVVDHGSPSRRLRGVATPFSGGDERVLLLVDDVTERERTDAIRRDFVANASHELKTPVATIIASSEAMRIALDRDDGSAKGFAERIEGSARQLDRLVNDLLDLSRLEKESPELSPARLDHLVRDEIERIRREAEQKDIGVETDLGEATVSVNRRDVAIAVRNLLDNAIRYTPAGGSVSVEVTLKGTEALISVSDTGEGIPTRDIERVFERFYRVDSARSRVTGGTGLGLSIVRHVVEGHGGRVSVESELGAGSTFTIRLPLSEEVETAVGR
jgi:two-component system, OmpR family, phosphate regulon sensor histidine kinase PhoR